MLAKTSRTASTPMLLHERRDVIDRIKALYPALMDQELEADLKDWEILDAIRNTHIFFSTPPDEHGHSIWAPSKLASFRFDLSDYTSLRKTALSVSSSTRLAVAVGRELPSVHPVYEQIRSECWNRFGFRARLNFKVYEVSPDVQAESLAPDIAAITEAILILIPRLDDEGRKIVREALG